MPHCPSGMNPEQQEFFQIMNGFRKLNLSSILPNISHGDFTVLQTIVCLQSEAGEECGVRVSDIVNRLQVSAPAVSRGLHNLEGQGLIVRRVDLQNRRNTYVDITTEGHAMVEEVNAIMSDLADAIFVQMGKENMKKLNAYMERFLETIKAELQKRKYQGEGEKCKKY